MTWSAFPAFHKEVVAAIHAAAAEHCGGAEAKVTCRFTHCYVDGPAPYYTVIVNEPLPTPTFEQDLRGAQWTAIKAAATLVTAKHGATSTHHHAVGKLHRPLYEAERGVLFGKTLLAVKQASAVL